MRTSPAPPAPPPPSSPLLTPPTHASRTVKTSKVFKWSKFMSSDTTKLDLESLEAGLTHLSAADCEFKRIVDALTGDERTSLAHTESSLLWALLNKLLEGGLVGGATNKPRFLEALGDFDGLSDQQLAVHIQSSEKLQEAPPAQDDEVVPSPMSPAPAPN